MKLDITDELRQTAGHLINGTIEDGEVPVAMLSDAADEIERLRRALTGIADYCSGEDQTLGAIKRLVAIRNTAEQAVRQYQQKDQG